MAGTPTMKLYWSSRSPYARKAALAAHEAGMMGRLQLVPTAVSTLAPDAAWVAFNALGQIPLLQLPDGSLLQDSLTICEFLDATSDRPHLFPPTGAARWRALGRQSEGQALMETLVKLFAERRRLACPLHPDYLRVHAEKFLRGVASLEAVAAPPLPAGADADIGDLAVACALAYADFRFAQIDWRAMAPRLVAWFDAFAKRPSMQATDFRIPSP